MNKRKFLTISLLLLSFSFSCSKQKPAPTVPDVSELMRHQNLGLAYLEENRLQEAKGEYGKIIQIAPNESLGYANLAICFLRLGDYTTAEKHAKEALRRSEGSEIRLIIAEIDDRSGKLDQAITDVEEALRRNPNEERLNFKGAQLFVRKADWSRAEQDFRRVVEQDPGNLAARLYFVESLVRNNRPDEALQQLQETRKQLLDLTPEQNQYFQSAINLLQDKKNDDALPAVISIHNLLKPSPYYQRSITELVGPGGAMIGFPVVHYSEAVLKKWKEEKTKPANLHLVETTRAAGIPDLKARTVATGDFDGDGKPDLFIAGDSRLLKNEGQKFSDITAASGIKGGQSLSAKFADYDNDGKPDLYVIAENAHVLYHNLGNGKFEDVTARAGIRETGGATPLFLDLDNEGDLDLLLLRPQRNRAYRNNGDGTFTDFTKQLGIENTTATAAVYADFDEDGDLDLFLTGGSRNVYLDNLRAGHFQEKKDTGLPLQPGTGAIAAADANNDGFVDMIVDGALYENKKDGTFQQKRQLSRSDTESLFTDIDNDGWKDVLSLSTNRLVLLRSEDGLYTDASQIFPKIPTASFLVFDYDLDGDEDVAAVDVNGAMHILRNDGGNTEYWINVRPVGLGPDSGKNNRNSVGAKVEVKSGALYQMQVVTEPVVHFGLGDHKQADVVRIVWTNGTSQNHVLPGINQTVVEKQVLKGSCAFLYAWNGKRFEFVTDVLWKSALGMPLGIMGGEMRYGFPNSTDEYLKIPGEALQLKDGSYSIRVTEELWEVAYLDQMRLIVLDHPAATDLYVDERFVLPPYPPLHIYAAAKKRTPLKGTDETGKDLLPLLREKDNRYAATFQPGAYQGIAATHDLILDLGKLSPGTDVVLFLNGWLFPTDASINVAVSQSNQTQIMRPLLQVPNAKGEWQTVLPDVGFPQGKNKTMVLDLKGKFLSNDYRIRIRTNMNIFWDQVFFTADEPDAAYEMMSLKPAAADFHYRGFSQMYRKGINGPHWFDYSKVSHEQKWRDLIGDYTRYGDVTPLLAASDDKYVMINSGDELSLRFDASKLPPLKKGWKRDFLLYSDGWMKDGDLSTADGKTVGPLPFHGMTQYPYDETKESYPRDAEHQAYLREYNTRKVTAEKFRKIGND